MTVHGRLKTRKQDSSDPDHVDNPRTLQKAGLLRLGGVVEESKDTLSPKRELSLSLPVYLIIQIHMRWRLILQGSDIMGSQSDPAELLAQVVKVIGAFYLFMPRTWTARRCVLIRPCPPSRWC